MNIKIQKTDIIARTPKHSIKLLTDGYVLKYNDWYFKFDNDLDEIALLSSPHDKLVWSISRLDISDLCNNCQFTIYEQVEEDIMWYDVIPEKGVMCKVWNSNQDKHHRLVIRYNSENDVYPFLDETGNHYRYARPLTLDEMKEYIL